MTDVPPSGARPPDGASLLLQQAAEIEHLRALLDDMTLTAEARSEERHNLAEFARLMAQLREANEHLVQATCGAFKLRAVSEDVNRKQLEFISMLAHELRTPLQPIALANEMIGRLGSAHPQLTVPHDVIARQIAYMSRLIEDLLDAGRLSRGKITLECAPVALSEILDSALETCAPMIARRHQLLHLNRRGDTAMVNGDRTRLSQAFANLLGNACKFTPEQGHISLRVRESALYVSVIVTDTGSGIDAALQPHIFELFEQGARAPGQGSGLGIGLALVRTIAEMHNGTVSVYSAGPGQGSEFMLTLPLAEPMPPPSSRQ